MNGYMDRNAIGVGPTMGTACIGSVGYDNRADKPQAELPAMLERAHGRMNELEKALSELEQRLAPVLRQEPATVTAAGQGVQAGSATPLGSTARELGDRAGNTCERVLMMLRLLEV